MAFTRNNYQEDDYRRDLQQSLGEGNYRLNLPRNDCVGCFAPNLPNSAFGGSLCQNIVDMDSELMGLNHKASRCPSERYSPADGEGFKNKNCGSKRDYKDCPVFTGEDTRLSNPPCTLRGTGYNRWEWLCQNPQDFAIEPFTRVINTVQIAKDSHRPCIFEPQAMNSALPNNYGIMDANPELVMHHDQGITKGVGVPESFNAPWKPCDMIG